MLYTYLISLKFFSINQRWETDLSKSKNQNTVRCSSYIIYHHAWSYTICVNDRTRSTRRILTQFAVYVCMHIYTDIITSVCLFALIYLQSDWYYYSGMVTAYWECYDTDSLSYHQRKKLIRSSFHQCHLHYIRQLPFIPYLTNGGCSKSRFAVFQYYFYLTLTMPIET